jgi:hypothetical protein
MFEDEVISDVKALAKAYAMGHGVAKMKTVSLRKYGHALFLDDFIKGKRSASVAKLQDMLGRFKTDWPAGVPWPKLKRLF